VRAHVRRLLTIATAGLALALAESGLSHYYYSRTYNYYEAAEVYWEDQSTLLLYLPHRVLFWTLRPNISLKASEKSTARGLSHADRLERLVFQIRVGPKGFRGQDFPAQKPLGELRIACLGDSRTIGEGLDEEATYPSRLESILRNRWPTRVRALNLGADGWSSYQGLQLLRTKAISYSPDVAVFAFGINDTDTDWRMTDHERALKLDTAFVSIQRALERSMLFYFAQRQFLKARGWLFGKTKVQGTRRAGKGPEVPRVSKEEYAANIAACITICREHGILPVLLIIPLNPYNNWESYISPDRVLLNSRELASSLVKAEGKGPLPASIPALRALVLSHPGFYPARHALAKAYQEAGDLASADTEFRALMDSTVFYEYNAEARRTATRMGALVVDLERDFLELKDHLFIDEMHPSPTGAELIARALAEALEKNLKGEPRTN